MHHATNFVTAGIGSMIKLNSSFANVIQANNCGTSMRCVMCIALKTNSVIHNSAGEWGVNSPADAIKQIITKRTWLDRIVVEQIGVRVCVIRRNICSILSLYMTRRVHSNSFYP